MGVGSREGQQGSNTLGGAGERDQQRRTRTPAAPAPTHCSPVLHDNDGALQDGPPQEGLHGPRHRWRVNRQRQHEHGGADGPVVVVDPPAVVGGEGGQAVGRGDG